MALNLEDITRQLGDSSGTDDARELLSPVLDALSNGSLAARFTWSPFGFLIADLSPPVAARLLRLHVWPKGFREEQGPHWPIHPHAWDLRSWVLTGSITNETYTIQHLLGDDGRPLYASKGVGGPQSVLVRTEHRVLCSLVGSTTYRAGQTYFVPQGQYHATQVPLDSLTATMAVMWNRADAPPLVVGTNDGLDTYTYERRVPELGLALRLLSDVNEIVKQEIQSGA